MAKSSKSKWNGYSLKPRKEMPEGLWMKCTNCEEMLYRSAVVENMEVCPLCNHHFRIPAAKRIEFLADDGSFQEFSGELKTNDPLNFEFRNTTYKDRIAKDEQKKDTAEAIRTGKAFIKGRGVILAVMDSAFMMGSMGSVVGEKFCRAIERAEKEKLPLICVTSSGGARMHEGVISLGQMAKTSAAVAKFDRSGGLFISLLTDPTTGGVSVRFAMLGDVIMAEPNELIAFARPRTIAETIKIELPEGFQRAEFLQEHGFVDMIVERKNLRSEIARLIDYCQK